MDKPYYHISEQALGEGAKIPLCKMKNSEEVFRAMADKMADCILRNNAAGRRTVFICPVGPVGQYPFFVERVNRERISLKDVWFLNMDEYLEDDDTYIDRSSPLSFRGFMDRVVYTQIDPELVMPEAQRVFPDPADPAHIDNLIEELGGVDIAFGGIGITGHLAFNEPQEELSCEAFAALPTRVRDIRPETRATNSVGDLGGALECMPRRCVTIGMKQILGAREICLGVFRDWHRAVVRRAAYGEQTAAFPTTLAQNHPNACIYVNDVAAKQPY